MTTAAPKPSPLSKKAFTKTVATVITPAAWFAGPSVVNWLLNQFSRGNALWLLLAATSFVLFPKIRRMIPITASISHEHLTALFVLEAVMGLGHLASSAPLPLQFLIVGFLTIPVFQALKPIIESQATELDGTYEYPPPPNDELRRYPLIRGLMRAVMSGKEKTRIRRIGLTGSWGSGKTLILDHVAWVLQKQDLVRAVKVDPWGCTSVQEARECLAEGMRVLLQKKSPSRMPLHKVLGKVFDLSDIVDAVFENDPTRRLDDSLKKLDTELRIAEHESNRRMVMVIDDMERAEPKIVRGLLPLLDELVDLEHCTFLIAVDHVHFRRAFGGTSSSCKSTQSSALVHTEADGFWAKVIDFTIELPNEMPRDRLGAWARIKLGVGSDRDFSPQPHREREFVLPPDVCPKLKNVLPELTPYLPQNPRALEKFLSRARLVEICFLGDYDDDEPVNPADGLSGRNPWHLFFHIQMMEAMFPGFGKALVTLKSDSLPSITQSSSDAFDNAKPLMTSALFGDEPNDFFESKLKEFLDSNWISLIHLRWHVSGFLCPPVLPGHLRRKLIQSWRQHPSFGVQALIEQAFNLEEWPEVVGVMGDLIKEFEQVPYGAASEDIVTGHVKRVEMSLRHWESSPYDRELLVAHVSNKTLGHWVAIHSQLTERFQDAAKVVENITKTLTELAPQSTILSVLHASEIRLLSPLPPASLQLSRWVHVRIQERYRAIAWQRAQEGASGSGGFPHLGDMLADPSQYFPPDSREFKDLTVIVSRPLPKWLIWALAYVWEPIREGIARWTNIEAPEKEADYWLMLWRAFEKSSEQVAAAKKIVLGRINTPPGFSKVRKACELY